MIYRGKSMQVTPAIRVGFDEAGAPFVQAQTGDPGGSVPEQPEPAKVLQAVLGMREEMLSAAAFLTCWKESATAPAPSRILIPPPGAVLPFPRNGRA